MQANAESKPPATSSAAPAKVIPTPAANSTRQSGSSQAFEELYAYVAIRDSLLAEAEDIMTGAKLDSVSIANEFVETCLRLSRAPYQAQHLPAADAARERKRCEAVTLRITKLRARIAPRPFAYGLAA